MHAFSKPPNIAFVSTNVNRNTDLANAPGDFNLFSSLDIGLRLFREYAFAFEASSILILVAMVGAVIIARKER